jgi:ribonuclease T2
MSTYWKDYQGNDETFWEHEWSKHGTCISTLDTNCYTNYVPQQEVVDFFNTTTKIFKNLPTYEALATASIVPLTGKTYTAAEIQAPLQAMHGASVILRCKNGALNDVWYHFGVRGSVQTGQFVPAEPNGTTSNCPNTGIRYLPKRGSPAPTGSTTATTTTTRNDIPSPTRGPFEGKGFLEVSCHGERAGCLISGGPWYASGTCAGFRAQVDIVEADGEAHFFTLTSSRGHCGFIHGRFECSKSLNTQSIFSSTENTEDGQQGGRKLSYRNSTTFFAATAPEKYEKVFLHTEKNVDHSLELEILWSPAT